MKTKLTKATLLRILPILEIKEISVGDQVEGYKRLPQSTLEKLVIEGYARQVSRRYRITKAGKDALTALRKRG